MGDELRRIGAILYKKLLMFYPKQFRDQFGASMEQTFRDICRDERGSHAVYTFFDTGIAMLKEQAAILSARRIMNGLADNPRVTGIIGFLLVLPGVAMLSSLLLSIDPPLGPFKFIVEGPPDGPHLLGSLIALTIILILPTFGLLINMASIRRVLFAAPNLILAAGVGLAAVVPFMILEMINGQEPYSNLPIPLFAILWLLPAAFFAILMPMMRSLVAGNDTKLRPTTVVLTAAVLVIIASMWAGIVIDQMPCFLGLPNCD
jgi:hypothetical protein